MSRPRTSAVRPSLETLDSRVCPSVFYSYRVAAVTGQSVPVPGSADVGTIEHLDHSPSINSAGQAAFTGYLDHIDGSESQEVFSWSETDGRTQLWNTFGDAHYVGRVNEKGQVATFSAVSSIQPGQVFPIRIDLLDLNTGAAQIRAFTTAAAAAPGAQNSFDFVYAVPAVNADGDIAYAARLSAAAATDPPDLYFQSHAVAVNSGTRLAAFPQPTGPFWQPSLADDGSLVVRDGSLPNSPIVVYNGSQMATIAPGNDWTVLGARPGISADGRIVAFYGHPNPASQVTNEDGIYASYRKPSGWSKPVRIAGDTAVDKLSGFVADARVSVNDTVADNPGRPGQRAATVVFSATGAGAAGIYSARLNYFGSGQTAFNPNDPAAVIAGTPSPVVNVGDEIPDLGFARVTAVAASEGVSGRDRGDVAFWCTLDDGREAIIRARPAQVLYLNFEPQANPNAGLSPAVALLYQKYFSKANAGDAFFSGTLEDAIRQEGKARTEAGSDLDQAFGVSGGRTSPTLRKAIVDGVQDAYRTAGVNVRVVGDRPAEGEFTTIAVGNQNNQTSSALGLSFTDAYNQNVLYVDTAPLLAVFKPDFGGVFVNRIFSGDTNAFVSRKLLGGEDDIGLGDNGINIRDPITAAQVVNAIVDVVAHESGHTLGLDHLNNASQPGLVMHAAGNDPPNQLRNREAFSTTARPLKDTPTASQNDQARLAFAVGSDVSPATLPRRAPDPAAFPGRLNFDLATTVPAGLRVQGAILGIRPAGSDSLLLIDLGAGDLADLVRRSVPLAPGDQVFLFATTTGDGIDLYSLPSGADTGTPLDFSNPYTILTDDRVVSAPADASGKIAESALRIVRVQGGQTTDLGSVGTEPSTTVPPVVPPAVPPSYLYVTADGGLFRETVANHRDQLGTLPDFPDDLAVAPDGTIYYLSTVGNTGVLQRVTVGPHDATVTPIGPLGTIANALDVRADGAIFAASLDTLYRLDPSTGTATAVSRASFAVLSAGDLVFATDGSIYLTSDTNGGELVHVSADLTTWTRIGATGVTGLGGLRVFGTKLRAYGHAGELYDIDPTTAATSYQGFLTAVSDVRGYGVGPADLSAVVPPPPPPPPTPAGPQPVRVGYPQFAAGADAGGETVTLYNPDGSVRYTAVPFAGFTGGVRTAAADFNGDGVADVVAGTGPGGPSRVVVLDGVTQAVLFDFAPFEASFVGGVYVAAGDLTGDGVPDLAVTPDEGGGPRVDVYSGKGFARAASFFGIDDPNFRGGARAAIADMTGDGTGDLIVVAGFGGGPRVAGFDGKSLGGTPQKIFADFFAFEDTLRNGVFVAAGDVNGDGFADLIAGGGPGAGPRVLAFDGKSLLAGQQVPVANFFGGDANSRGGIRLAVKDLDGDAKADLVVGAGADAGSRVTAYLGKDLGTTAFDLDAAGVGANGVFVG